MAGRRDWTLWLGVLSGLLVVAFFLFPLAHTRWGDAFMLAKGIAYPEPALRLTHSWQAPLDVFLHSQLWLALHAQLGWEDAMPVYRLLSPVAGAVYLGVVLALSRDSRLAPAWLTYGLLATLGVMQLFFGYVENYSFAAAGVLAFLWLGKGVLTAGRPLWLAATVLAIANATHPSTVILAPSLLYLGWCTWRGGGAQPQESVARRNNSLLTAVVQIALPMLLVGGATLLWMEASGHGLYALFNTDRPGGGDARWFVPLFTTVTRWEHYTLFSWPHLRDWINEQLLVAPVVLPSLCVVLVAGWRTRWQATARFLALAAVCYLLFTFVWNPDYGGQRDRDLFALAALPTTLLLIARLPVVLPAFGLLWGGAVPLIIIQGWQTLAWIYQNTLPWQWPD